MTYEALEPLATAGVLSEDALHEAAAYAEAREAVAVAAEEAKASFHAAYPAGGYAVIRRNRYYRPARIKKPSRLDDSARVTNLDSGKELRLDGYWFACPAASEDEARRIADHLNEHAPVR